MTKFVRIVKANSDAYWYADKIGEVFKVDESGESDSKYYVSERIDGVIRMIDMEDAEEIVEESEGKTSPQTDRDLIIELAYTVAKLERKVESLEKSLQEPSPWATAEEVRLVDEKAEMLIDDVVMLDDRTQPLTDDGAKEFAEGLSDVIEEYVNDRITRDQIRMAYD